MASSGVHGGFAPHRHLLFFFRGFMCPGFVPKSYTGEDDPPVSTCRVLGLQARAATSGCDYTRKSEVLGIEPRPSHMPGKCCTTHPKPSLIHLMTVFNPCYEGAEGSARQTDLEEKHQIEAGRAEDQQGCALKDVQGAQWTYRGTRQTLVWRPGQPPTAGWVAWRRSKVK